MAVAATESSGTVERATASGVFDGVASAHARRPATLGADEGHDDGQFLADVESREFVPHVPLAATRSRRRRTGRR